MEASIELSADDKKDIMKEIIKEQQLKKVINDNTFRIIISSINNTTRQAGERHNNFTYRVPSNLKCQTGQYKVKLNSVFLPFTTRTFEGGRRLNMVIVKTNFLKGNTAYSGINGEQMTGSVLAVAQFKENAITFIPQGETGAPGTQTYARMNYKGSILVGGGTGAQQNPYIRFRFDGNAERTGTATAGTPDAAGEIVLAQADKRFFKSTSDGAVGVGGLPEAWDTFPNNGQPNEFYNKLENAGSVVQGAGGAQANVIGITNNLVDISPSYVQTSPYNVAFQYRKDTLGGVCIPLDLEWLPCQNPFGTDINIQLVQEDGITPVQTGTDDEHGVIVDMTIERIPDYFSGDRIN